MLYQNSVCLMPYQNSATCLMPYQNSVCLLRWAGEMDSAGWERIGQGGSSWNNSRRRRGKRTVFPRMGHSNMHATDGLESRQLSQEKNLLRLVYLANVFHMSCQQNYFSTITLKKIIMIMMIKTLFMKNKEKIYIFHFFLVRIEENDATNGNLRNSSDSALNCALSWTIILKIIQAERVSTCTVSRA